MTTEDVFDSAARGLLYAVLDAADAPAVPDKMEAPEVQAQALYESNLNPDLRLAAPYLVRLNLDLMTWIYEELWNDPWGILVETDLELKDLRRHLRRFLLVQDPQGTTLYFRFYDPRVLRTFLGSCNDPELADFFGPVEAYIARGNDPGQFTRYALLSPQDAAPCHRSIIAGAHGPAMKMREAQMHAFSGVSARSFENRMFDHVGQFFPEQCAMLGEARTRELIREGIDRAARYSVISERDVCKYIDLMLVYGRSFGAKPELPWARAILNNRTIDDPSLRVNRLYEAAMEHARAESDLSVGSEG